MFKLVILASLCVAAVFAQAETTTTAPESSLSRMARGAPDLSSMPDMVNKEAEAVKSGVEGIMGNIPDPTAMIKKGQEMAGQMASGRRRRHSLTEAPALPIV